MSNIDLPGDLPRLCVEYLFWLAENDKGLGSRRKPARPNDDDIRVICRDRELIGQTSGGDYLTRKGEALIAEIRLGGRQPSAPRLHVEADKVTLDGTVYVDIPANGVDLMRALVEARGNWVCASNIISHPKRALLSLPVELRDLIEAAAGKGYRIRADRPI